MTFSIIPLVISCFLLGAHFLRSGNPLLTLWCVLTPFLLLIKRRWILVIVQLVAYTGGVIWINTAIQVMRKRINMGLPWDKPVIILGVVAGFSILSGLLLNLKGVRAKYSKKSNTMIDNEVFQKE